MLGMLSDMLSGLELTPTLLLAAAAPPLANVLGIWLCKVTGYDKGSREEDAEKINEVALTLLGQFPGNIILSLVYPSGQWSVLSVFIGMLVLDTAEYWVHRLLHANKWLYRMTHQTHHMPPVCAALSLYNSACEVLPFTSCITLSFYLSGITWMDFIIVTSLAQLKTAWDHASTRKGHHHELHHAKPCYNFEQPFFDVWDRLMGTRAWPETIEAERLERVKALAERKVATTTTASATGTAAAMKVSRVSRGGRAQTPRGPRAVPVVVKSVGDENSAMPLVIIEKEASE